MPKQILSRQNILKIAISTIDEGEDATFSNIARKLGSRPQALYPYFHNQTDLSYAILKDSLDFLTEELKTKLLAKTGRSALFKMSIICREVGLRHKRLTRYLLLLPKDKADEATKSSFEELRSIFRTLLSSSYSSEKEQLLVGRMLRDLIIGDLVNVGTGWFTDPSMTTVESFKWMVNNALEIIDNQSFDN